MLRRNLHLWGMKDVLWHRTDVSKPRHAKCYARVQKYPGEIELPPCSWSTSVRQGVDGHTRFVGTYSS